MVNPTGYTALDLIGFTDKGDYSSANNYVRNDLAHYAGSIWRCLIDDTSNVTPAENANWTVFVSEPSNQVEASIAPIEVSPAQAAHAQGTQLYYNGTLYKAKTAIAIGDSLVVNTNIEVAPKITEQLADKANTSDLGTAAAKDSTNTVTQNDTDLVESGAVYTVTQGIKVSLAKVEADIAPVEDGNTASQAYAIGEQFIKGDELFKAKTAIAQGDTLTLNTNYEAADNVTDQLVSVKTALSNEVATRTKVGAHQLLPLSLGDIKARNTGGTWSGNVYTGASGVVFTVNADNSITVTSDGTGSSADVLSINHRRNSPLVLSNDDYLFSGISGGALDTCYAVVNGTDKSDNSEAWMVNCIDGDNSFTYDSSEISGLGVSIVAYANKVINMTIKPLIRVSTDPSTAFTSYAPTNRECVDYKTNSILGAHNLLEFPSLDEIKAINTSGTWSGNVYTFGNVTFTVDTTNKQVTVNCDGTGSSNGYYLSLYNRISARYYLENGTYKLNGVDNGVSDKFYITANATTRGGSSQAWYVIGTDKEGIQFVYNSSQVDGLGVAINVLGNYEVSNAVVKPMIRLASDTDPTYQPYAMTNRELTENKLGRPDYANAKDITSEMGALNLNEHYVAPDNGYVFIVVRQTSTGTRGQFRLTIGNVIVLDFDANDSTVTSKESMLIPVNESNWLKVTAKSSVTVSYAYFVPAF